MSSHGGKRQGAGRPPGRANSASKGEYARFSENARCFAEEALNVLRHIALTSQSEPARVSAAVAILNRAYGRPRQAEPSIPDERSTQPTVIRLIAGSSENSA